jgi:hypothetical protein
LLSDIPAGDGKNDNLFLQCIVSLGYGGERFYSSDEDEDSKEDATDSSGGGLASASSDTEAEVTAEERNMRNLTLKNTTFNAHAQNLLRDPAPAVRLGQERRPSPPVISVREAVDAFLTLGM